MTAHTPNRAATAAVQRTRAASVGCFVAALLLPVPPMGTAAQGIPTAEITSRFQVGFFGGYLSHSLLGEVTGTLTTAMGDLSVSTDVEAEATNVIGGLIGWRLSNAAAVRIRAARSGTHVRLIALATPIGGSGAQRFTFGDLGDVETWFADAELLWEPISTETSATPYVVEALSANVRETRSTQRIRVGRRQRKRTCWDCEREWKRMVVPLEPGRPSEARQLLRTRR